MPEWNPHRAIEIDKKLRDDFRRMLREYGITTQETDLQLAGQVEYRLPGGWVDVGASPMEAVVGEIGDEAGLE